jgi:putative transposase
MKYPKRKSIRLEKELYYGPMIGMATLCFYKRHNVISSKLADLILYQINKLSEKLKVTILIYCLMPDHLHLILEIKNSSQNFIDVIHYFKRKIAFELREKIPLKQFWQDRFIDRIIRDEKELEKMIWYILDNPVRKNLVNDFRKWPYSGGYYFHRKK